MRIIIAGCGKIGSTMVESLSGEYHASSIRLSASDIVLQ
jgi:Trk K+ transport system NAD-binding subunit